MIRLLIDTGSSKNFIRPRFVRRPIPNQKPFFANSIGGSVEISHHTYIEVGNSSLKFFVLPSLNTFDGILGNDSLRELSAVINTGEGVLILNDNSRIKLKQRACPAVNAIDLRAQHMTASQKEGILKLTRQYPSLFSDPDERLTFTTNVVGQITTNTDTAIYSKSYPYPMTMRPFVDKEIGKLLADGIIRPSRSPYNSPVWVVPKKSDASGQRKYRLVIDYRKLNSVTVPDRYPIPEINEVISQLGENMLFSVLDLKSGFHQIPLKETDIEKTAFSVNNGKYEFTRLPFGLKNAPSIFQRALDDILRDHIGKICYVYIDDILIFSKDEKSHMENIRTIFSTLHEANLKVQLDKCDFFKEELEFLGFVISSRGVKTNPSKVEAIGNFPIPKTLRELRSFLGMSGFYRRFIKDYAKLAKPLTSYLRGENGRTAKKDSSVRKICLNKEALDAFGKLKTSLISQDVVLAYPDLSKEFHLTTDASNYALGAVLEQSGKPITFLSRSLSETEEKYATNEKEMLAIIWALDSLKFYLYGTAKVIIFTDHQPLTFALHNKNNNARLRKWKCRLEEYDYELRYKPGKSNIVADALSRIPTVEINATSVTCHSDESSSHDLIYSTEAPINAFKNQIFLNTGKEDYRFLIPFPGYHRHLISRPSYSTNDLVDILKRRLDPSLKNGIFTSESIMGKIQEIYPQHFLNIKSCFTQTVLRDVVSESIQDELILREHKRAHRSSRENKTQLLSKYYFPKMLSRIEGIVKLCSVCREQKYDRHPPKPELKPTPIPTYPGEIVHVDIFSTEKKLVLTALDKFSKYAQVKIIPSRAIEHIRGPLTELMHSFGIPKSVVIDNEKALNSASISFLLKDQMGIEVFTTPPYSSTVNGQVERFHSTLSEIMRCLKPDNSHVSFEELLYKSLREYNSTVHSTVKKKPIETFFGNRVFSDPVRLDEFRLKNIDLLRQKQTADLDYHNRNRSTRQYHPGDIIFVKLNKRLGSKLTPRFRKEVVDENFETTIRTTSGKVVHKNNIKT